ncbi:MAG: antibiotic acetyltransferase [Actinobacteria bacterium]|nr:antibiotic acetyltransferase [Actinomycetota bacterium]
MGTRLNIQRMVNARDENLLLDNRFDVVLEPGALIMNSSIEAGMYMERYSAINRCEIEGPVGVGSFAYVADARLAKYVHIGARSIVGGFEHPTDRLSVSGLFWGQNVNVLGIAPSADSVYSNLKPDTPTTILGSDVWVSANATILSGLRLAHGTVIGAGSVLTRDTEPYGIYVGNPARLIRFRFSDHQIAALLDSRWWELPPKFLLSLEMNNIEDSLEKVTAFRAAGA